MSVGERRCVLNHKGTLYVLQDKHYEERGYYTAVIFKKQALILLAVVPNAHQFKRRRRKHARCSSQLT